LSIKTVREPKRLLTKSFEAKPIAAQPKLNQAIKLVMLKPAFVKNKDKSKIKKDILKIEYKKGII